MSSTLVLDHFSPSPDNNKQLLTRSFSGKQRHLSSSFNRSQSLLYSSSTDRRQMLLAEQELWSSTSSHAHGTRRFNEVAGGTTAAIAAVACCAPFGIADLVLLAVYKVPTGLCRKALREKRRRRLMKKGSLLLTPAGHDHMCECSLCDGSELEFRTKDPVIMVEAMEKDDDMMQLEKEMWDKFYGSGFLRSNSRPVSAGL